MNKLIILNHKMNLEYDDVYSYIDKLNKLEISDSIIVVPSNIYLESFVNNSFWGVGAQDVYYKNSGNYTGEVSVRQLKSLGIEYVIVGHYERIKIFKESRKLINKKLKAVMDANIEPILCFGALGDEDSIKRELDELLKDITNIDFIIFAYEPLELDEMQDVDTIIDRVNYIYDYLRSKYKSVPNIVYGGGISSDNINEILSIDKVNGVVIGSVSANIKKIDDIIESINR